MPLSDRPFAKVLADNARELQAAHGISELSIREAITKAPPPWSEEQRDKQRRLFQGVVAKIISAATRPDPTHRLRHKLSRWFEEGGSIFVFGVCVCVCLWSDLLVRFQALNIT